MTDPIPGARNLTADDLGIGVTAPAVALQGSSAPDASTLDPEAPQFLEIARLREQFGGVILTGPPGTSKSWLAKEAAVLLTKGEESRTEFIQFHASYQFEDFMEGFRPREDGGGFEPRAGVFLSLVERAIKDPEDRLHVLVIDELSRADVGRVFGEALTFVERSKRNTPFSLPSGRKLTIPSNLFIIATMNPLDRGVDDVDAAFERRFAKIEMLPDSTVLRERLDANEVPEELAGRLLAWFGKTNGRAKTTPAAAVGHAYFWSVVDEDSLRDVWNYQLRYLIERAFKYDEPTLKEVVGGWNKIFEGITAEEGADDEPDETL